MIPTGYLIVNRNYRTLYISKVAHQRTVYNIYSHAIKSSYSYTSFCIRKISNVKYCSRIRKKILRGRVIG